MAQSLREYQPVVFTLEEAEDGPWKGFKKIRGIFGECDKPTKNGRAYPRPIMEREIARLQPKIVRRALYGELDHPADGQTRLERASHIITGLSIDESGVVVGEAVIMKTPRGQILEAIIAAGGEVGISSRGRGDVKSNGKYEEVQDNFVLGSYDVVADPAMASAIPQVFEGTEEKFEWTPEVVHENFPGLYDQITALVLSEDSEPFKAAAAKYLENALAEERVKLVESLERSVAERLQVEIGALQESVDAKNRKELLEDPEVGGAKALLGQIHEITRMFYGADDSAVADAVSAARAEATAAKEESAAIASKLQEATYALYVEKQISGHPLSDTARQLLSDVSRCESLEEVKTRVATVLSDLGSVSLGRKRDEAEEMQAKIASLEAKLAESESERDALNSVLEEARTGIAAAKRHAADMAAEAAAALHEASQLREANKIASLTAYRARSVVGFSNAERLISLTEGVATEEEVDAILAEHAQVVVAKSEQTLESARNRLRRGFAHDGSDVVTENSGDGIGNGSDGGGLGRVNRSANSEVFGVPMEELARLT